jgi:predicted alpha/beta-hydrolase family hydrolase
VQRKNLGGLDLYTHSHGGSVAMLANQAGTDVGRMVLLSCPVHRPKYAPDFNHTQKVVSIRVHLDLVILADGGGQRFDDSRIAEHELPIWFDHFATHDPANWQNYAIATML